MVFDILPLILLPLSILLSPIVPLFFNIYFASFGIDSPILLILILIIILSIFYYIYKPWKACENTAQKVNYFSLWLNRILLLELFALSGFTIFNLITNQSMRSQFLNVTSSSYLRDFITGNLTGAITFLIGIISIIAVYLYFFTVLGKTTYFSELSEVQVKYTEVFWRLSLFIFLGSLAILCLLSITKTENIINGALFFTGLINLIFTIGIPYFLKQYFYNLNLIPQKKTTIELIDTGSLGNFSKITDVFILSKSSKDYVLILDKNNQICKIMKTSIRKLIDQNE